MKLYLVYDKNMGSYYCPSQAVNGDAWMGEAYKHHCLMEDKDEAKKIIRTMGMSRRNLHVQVLEVEMPEEEYQAIQDELVDSIRKFKRAGIAAPSIAKHRKIQEGEA